jgi:hypothetical protein
MCRLLDPRRRLMFLTPGIVSQILLPFAAQIIGAPPSHAAPAATVQSPHSHRATPAAAVDPQAEAAFAQLRTLVGTWDMASTTPGGRSYKDKVVYRMASGGSVLFEEIGPSASMLTTYHLDKGSLVLTHYCTVGNQPRMRLRSVADAGRTLAFEIYDITNLASPEAYHSTNLIVSFVDQNRVQLAYTGKSAGKEQKAVFDLTRQVS